MTAAEALAAALADSYPKAAAQARALGLSRHQWPKYLRPFTRDGAIRPPKSPSVRTLVTWLGRLREGGVDLEVVISADGCRVERRES